MKIRVYSFRDRTAQQLIEILQKNVKPNAKVNLDYRTVSVTPMVIQPFLSIARGTPDETEIELY
jgi:hypothetical protein